MNLKDTLHHLVTSAFEDDTYFVVEINVAGSEEGMKKISIILDCDTSITIDQCAQISRKVARELEEKDVIPTAFVLEVSSPGLDRPFSLLRQYQKNLGKRVDITLNDGKVKRGKISAVNEHILELLEEVPSKRNKKINEEVACTINMSEIKKTVKVVLFK